jgi:hypothetical protein
MSSQLQVIGVVAFYMTAALVVSSDRLAAATLRSLTSLQMVMG